MKNKNIYKIASISILLLFAFFISCRKDEIIKDSTATLRFSTDTVMFDTVFTTIGSATKQLKVFNPYNKIIKISNIRLGGGAQSNFKINVNGIPSSNVSDMEINPKDSMFIFVRVTVDPNNQNTPFIITDSLTFETNGNIQKVKLVAMGQNAYFIIADTYAKGLPNYKIVAHENEKVTWKTDKPYVIYGYAVIDSTGSLTIPAGARIYLHPGAGIWVYKGGSIQVNGTKDSVVVFQGDRLEAWYKDSPGQWDRIWINEGSENNVFNYAIIRNGFIGIQAEIINSAMTSTTLILKNTIIQNMSAFGLFTKAFTVNASNTIISDCGSGDVYLSTGGSYDFRHCTLANNWTFGVRKNPSLIISNYFKDNANNIIYTGELKSYFGNCIIYGNNEEEILADFITGVAYDYTFANCLVKSKLSLTAPHFTNCIANSDPLFTDESKHDYHLSDKSPAINKGVIKISTPYLRKDYDDVNRFADGLPDLGAFEYVPKP